MPLSVVPMWRPVYWPAVATILPLKRYWPAVGSMSTRAWSLATAHRPVAVLGVVVLEPSGVVAGVVPSPRSSGVAEMMMPVNCPSAFLVPNAAAGAAT